MQIIEREKMDHSKAARQIMALIVTLGLQSEVLDMLIKRAREEVA